MAPKLRIQRESLAEFIKDHDTIRQFEEIFRIVDALEVAQNPFPVGFTYMQLPGTLAPDELGFSGTWENVSSEFAGDFFRVEGGNASAFEAGEQLDLFQGHKHTFTTYTRFSSGLGGGGSAVPFYDTTPETSDPVDDGINGPPRTGIETRPVNHTIRVWRRTA